MEVKKEKNGLLTIQTVYGKEQTKLSLTDVDCLLWAIGRVPNSLDLGLKELVSFISLPFFKDNVLIQHSHKT